MRSRKVYLRAGLLSGVAFSIAALSSTASAAETAKFAIPPQPLDQALRQFGAQSGHPMLLKTQLLESKQSQGLFASADPETALRQLLSGTGLTYKRDGEVFAIVAARDDLPARRAAASLVAAETVSGSAVEGLVVTAQKRREAIQDVPIAISAFSADALQAQKIEGGFDLLKAIPNVTFSKNNFSSYNFSIRGIGTKAISVTTDPGVAVEFNDAPLIRNRLFEQEYFDVERVEVLRGPQGTLHGRNATAGVINVISKVAELDVFDGRIKGEVGNFHTKRLSGFINAPLIEDVLAVRFAGALTARDGYDYNATTKNRINGRDLWSGRLTIGFEPTDAIRADFIWERFSEDDNRSRTGKQLCHRDEGPETLGAIGSLTQMGRGALSQGCKPGNLYDDAAFGTPNGLSIPFISYLSIPQASWGALGLRTQTATVDDLDQIVTAVNAIDPYGGLMQSRDMRVINSIKDPRYRADTDVFELNVDIDIGPSLSFVSQTAYVDDSIYSFQDFNRFTTVPIFNDTTNLFDFGPIGNNDPSPFRPLLKGAIYCDPQIGCADSLAGFDISRAQSEQFSQEFRLQSDFDGTINFSVGVNYMRYTTLEDYFVFYNLVTLAAQTNGPGFPTLFNGSPDITNCVAHTFNPSNIPAGTVVDIGAPGSEGCIYIDPNPIESINGEGHNYFRSMNPYKLTSAAAFGEVYWRVNDVLKFTFGLRYTDDRKTFTPVPSQALLSRFIFLGGTVDRGYPALDDIEQHWGEWSGRIGVDWKPDLAFTDDTLIYAFYSRGYKGGGANPPGIGYATEENCDIDPNICIPPLFAPLSYSKLFDPEFVNAYEIGAKNTLLGGALVLNATTFYYDYKNYQVSQIKERTAVNENFDATVWGLEFESVFAASEDLRFNMSLGYQDSSIADGEQSIDLMNRTQGQPGWVVIKPWVQMASNCVAAVGAVEELMQRAINDGFPDYSYLGANACPGLLLSNFPPDRSTWPNGGAGFFADLSGNELPNAPHWTVSLGGEYGWNLLDGAWRATVRADAYWQSQSWARVYNLDPYDKLHGWYNANLSMWIEKPEDDLRIEFYVKNLLDDTPITDAFLNSDDTALTTNVFTLDPRLIGLQITKGF